MECRQGQGEVRRGAVEEARERAQLPNSSPNSMATGLQWWRALAVDDPISLDPIKELPYEPFELTADGAVSYHFDGKLLANYLISTGQFSHPVSRRPLDRSECQRLDSYLRHHRLGTPCVARVFDSMRDNQNTAEVADLRTQAQSILASLFENSRGPPAMLHAAPSGAPASRSWGMEAPAENGWRLEGPADRGWRVIDDDEQRIAQADQSEAELAWPELPPAERRADEERVAISAEGLQWRPQLATVAPPAASNEEEESQPASGRARAAAAASPAHDTHRSHNPAAIYSALPAPAPTVAPPRSTPRSSQPRSGRGSSHGGTTSRQRRDGDGDSQEWRGDRPRYTRQVWCDGMGWIGVPAAPPRSSDEPATSGPGRKKQDLRRSRPSIPSPALALHAPAPNLQRGPMVTAQMSVRSGG